MMGKVGLLFLEVHEGFGKFKKLMTAWRGRLSI